jgi:hypothetical protein
VRALLVLLAVALVSPELARAQKTGDFVGTWYSETKEDKVFQGQAYDLRRELIVNRDDGTKVNTNRYYRNGVAVGETVATYTWGVDAGLYWTVCRTLIVGGQSSTCSTRNEYEIISVGPREVRYKSKTSGTTYSSIRVASDFRLP